MLFCTDNVCKHLIQISSSPVHGGPTSQLIGLEDSAAKILVPDTTGHLQSGELHATMVLDCFGSKRETTQY